MSRVVAVPRGYDLGGTLAPLRLGAGDRTVRVEADAVWRATRTPEGAATGRYRLVAADEAVVVDAWGPGSAWLLEHAPDLLGCNDDLDGFADLASAHPVVHEVARRRPGLRLPRSLDLCGALLPAILSQKVTGLEARRAWRALVRGWGEPAPGPAPLRLPPAPAVLAEVPYHALHPIGVERKRAEVLRSVAAAAAAGALEPSAAGVARAAAIRGVGPWTIAEATRVALGDADAVSVGDYHLPSTVCWALARERRGDDARMLELLAPFAPHRGRVCRFLEAAHLFAPRRGARLAPIDNRRR